MCIHSFTPSLSDLKYDQSFAQLRVLHCTATVHVHCVAARHHVIPRIPDDAQETAVTCCRIMSGRTLIDPLEPSPALIWYALVHSDF